MCFFVCVCRVFEDVPPMLRMLSEEGFVLHVFSSGSVEAQKLLFANTSEGDITDVSDIDAQTFFSWPLFIWLAVHMCFEVLGSVLALGTCNIMLPDIRWVTYLPFGTWGMLDTYWQAVWYYYYYGWDHQKFDHQTWSLGVGTVHEQYL